MPTGVGARILTGKEIRAFFFFCLWDVVKLQWVRVGGRPSLCLDFTFRQDLPSAGEESCPPSMRPDAPPPTRSTLWWSGSGCRQGSSSSCGPSCREARPGPVSASLRLCTGTRSTHEN